MKRAPQAVDDPVRPPQSWQRLTDRYPDIAAAYDVFSDVCRQSGPLDEATVAIVKLAVSVGRGASRTVHSHAKKALRNGADPQALRQVALSRSRRSVSPPLSMLEVDRRKHRRAFAVAGLKSCATADRATPRTSSAP
jgi:AhpD family alkylhydroperoxidase